MQTGVLKGIPALWSRQNEPLVLAQLLMPPAGKIHLFPRHLVS
jgi:hypothetical protein